jgi:hypothetical protein
MIYEVTIIVSPELKAPVSYSDRRLSVVRPSVNLYSFDFFSRATGLILTRLGTDHLWGEGFQVCSNEGDCPSPRGNNSESVKIHWKFLKIFSRTSGPNSIKLGTNYPWVKGIKVCSNKGPNLLQRGDNHKNVKIGWGHLKIFFSRTTGPILIRLGTNHPWGQGIQVCSNEEDSPSPRGDNNKKVKIHWIFKKKSSSPEPAGQIQSNLIQIILGWREIKFVQIRGQIFFKGEIITKM